MTATYFTPSTFTFLRDLRANNNREWFQENKHRYEDHLKDPAIRFISDFGGHLKKASTSTSRRVAASPAPECGVPIHPA